MGRVRLFHSKAAEAAAAVDTLQAAGFVVDYQEKFHPEALREMRQSPPEAVVIDLSRLPSHGREVAIALRGNKATRLIPILFVGGAREKVEVVRQTLPDAAYCAPASMVAALRKCLDDRPQNPVVPQQMMDRYQGRTTAQKLGITAGSKVAVLNAPRDYARVIGDLPERVEFDEESTAGCAVTIWFVEDPETYLAALPKMRRLAQNTKLWIAWPKKAARKDSLLNENLIRDMAIENGLVDYKVCSVNATWSGLCLALKKVAGH
jgi:CheY-like chemotaxis protein